MSLSQSLFANDEEKCQEPAKTKLMSDAQQIDRLGQWIKHELETIKAKMDFFYSAGFYSKKKHASNIKELHEQVNTHLTSDLGPAATIEKIITAVNNEFRNLVKEYNIKQKTMTEKDSLSTPHYEAYNNHLKSREKTEKSRYPRILACFVLNIKTLARDDNTCSQLRGIISRTIESDIYKIEKQEHKNHGLETFAQYLARVLTLESNQKALSSPP